MSLILPTIPQEYKNFIFVYMDCRPNGDPFYVGIGLSKRVRTTKRNTNTHHQAIINKYDGCYRKILCIANDRNYANQIEQKLIEKFGRYVNQTGNLVNRSAGGDGYVNPTQEIRDARRKAMTGKTWKISPNSSRAGTEAARIVNMGNKYTLGFKLSDEAKAKISATHKGKLKSNEMKLKLSNARHLRNLKVSEFLKQTNSSIFSRKVTNKMMDDWFLRGVF